MSQGLTWSVGLFRFGFSGWNRKLPASNYKFVVSNLCKRKPKKGKRTNKISEVLFFEYLELLGK